MTNTKQNFTQIIYDVNTKYKSIISAGQLGSKEEVFSKVTHIYA